MSSKKVSGLCGTVMHACNLNHSKHGVQVSSARLVQDQDKQTKSQRLGVAQVVEHLPSKGEALSSIPSTGEKSDQIN
jgi:hypothetical protein